jgi:hypothetical protein
MFCKVRSWPHVEAGKSASEGGRGQHLRVSQFIQWGWSLEQEIKTWWKMMLELVGRGNVTRPPRCRSSKMLQWILWLKCLQVLPKCFSKLLLRVSESSRCFTSLPIFGIVYKIKSGFIFWFWTADNIQASLLPLPLVVPCFGMLKRKQGCFFFWFHW